jgi:uncharacterized protein (DUF697 family)
MAAIFDFALSGGRADDIVARLCGMVLGSAVHSLVPKNSCPDAARLIGGIVTAAEFPEFGIPIAIVGYLIGNGWRRPRP